jgi:hypothetical protein
MGGMPKRRLLDLHDFDDKLLDGLKFCLKAYDLFDQIRAEPDGLEKIRLLRSKREKRLLEELLPIAEYIQTKYRVGNRLKIRWLSGSQPYDAILWTPLVRVRNSNVPRKIFVEVTTSAHEHAHLARKMLHETGFSFGAKGIKINKKSRVPHSEPYVYDGPERVGDLVLQIVGRIANKAQKGYPANTVLIINCNADGLITEGEWREAIKEVEGIGIHKSFREVVMIEPVGNHAATLWGSPQKRIKFRKGWS